MQNSLTTHVKYLYCLRVHWSLMCKQTSPKMIGGHHSWLWFSQPSKLGWCQQEIKFKSCFKIFFSLEICVTESLHWRSKTPFADQTLLIWTLWPHAANWNIDQVVSHFQMGLKIGSIGNHCSRWQSPDGVRGDLTMSAW